MAEDNGVVALDKTYEASEKDKKALTMVYDRFTKMLSIRGRSYAYFNDRDLVTYIDDSTRRWNGYVPPRDDLSMDWQARVFDNFTRNVSISFLSKVALNPPKIKITATDKQGMDDQRRAYAMEKMRDYSLNHENGEWKFFESSLELVTKGTVIAYEGYAKNKRKIRELSKYDATTGEWEAKEKDIIDFEGCYRRIIPLEDFYISNIYQPNVQLQPDVIWKQVLKKSEFLSEFGRYKKSEFVKEGMYNSVVENTTFYKTEYICNIGSDSVEVIRWYSRWKDRMIIAANGVLLYDGPIPFAHKMLPFARGIFEPFAVDFFYGKSLPDKVIHDQDTRNTLMNMMLDQSFLSIFKPILTSDPDEMDDTVLIPGLIKKVSDVNQYRVMNELSGPDSSHFNMYNLVSKQSMDNAGGIMGGASSASPRGGKVSARQALMAAEQAQQTLGLNLKMLEDFEYQCALLRCPNLLQFNTIPQKIDEISDVSSSEWKKLFMREIRVSDTVLSDGTYGTSIIRIARNKNKLPSQTDIAVEEEAAALGGNNVEVIVVSPEYIRDMDVDIEVVRESSYLQLKSITQAMGLEFYNLAKADKNINQLENTRDFIKLYDKEPNRLMLQQAPGMPGAAPLPPQDGLGGAGGQGTPQVASQILGRGDNKSLESMVGQK